MSKELRRTNTLVRKDSEKYWQTFITAFIIFVIMVLPIIIYNKGYFTYYGDYNSQQIPFYNLAHRAVLNGNIFWDWGTDLGSNFIGSYSFYLLGSPFFWITLLFPQSMVTFLMPFLLGLKHAVAALTAYAYIRRFVRNKNACMIGGLLYAFSSFQAYNIFFNHFQDVTAFFPLLLIALEDRVNQNRRGVFALTVALMAMLNYFFFSGQVVFLVIYFIVRCFCKDFKITGKKFIGLAIESIIGVALAAFILIPSAFAILDNYRVNERLKGLDLLIYNDRTRIWRILQSFFMIPDVPARTNLFSSDNAKWSSIAGYLPLFSMAGVLSFIKNKHKHWASLIVGICALFACVPILNSSFYMFNASYYARWFYMPILIMAMMTAYVLDNRQISFKFGIKICSAFLILMGLFSIVPKVVTTTFGEKTTTDTVWFQLPSDTSYFWGCLLLSISGILILIYINSCKTLGKPYMRKSVAITCIACFLATSATFYYGISIGPYPEEYIENGINGAENLTIEKSDTEFYRLDTSQNYDNYPMFWDFSTMRTFHSIVPASIMEFYPEVDVTRDVASRVDTSHYTLRGLFSVKYYFDKVDEMNSGELMESTYEIDLPGFEYRNTENDFQVYENKYYIPMGFTFDNYISSDTFENLSKSVREKNLISSIVLDENQIEKYGSLLSETTSAEAIDINEADYLEECQNRAENASYSFEHSTSGFTSKIKLKTDNLVFFSVPYDSGWSATVNGQYAEIEKVDIGFMAVKAPAGDNTIEFHYETPGLRYGIIISLGGILLFIFYMIITSAMRKKETDSYDYYDDEKHNKVYTHKYHYDYENENSSVAQEVFENKLVKDIKAMDNGVVFSPQNRETILNEELGIDIDLENTDFTDNDKKDPQ